MSQSLDNMSQRAEARFQIVSDLSEIPDSLIQQVKELKGHVSRIRENMEISARGNGLIFGLYTEKLLGFCWVEIEPSENNLYIHAYSVDKSLWHTGSHLKSLIRFLESLKSILKVHKVRWFTDRPGLYRKLGYKPSRTIMMEA